MLYASACANDNTTHATYVLDPSFPRPSEVSFDVVTWAAFDRTANQLVLLQRSQPAVTMWSPSGNLVDMWETTELGDPHSIKLRTIDGERFVWITDMAPPNPAGPAFGHCLKSFSLSGKPIGSIGVCGKDSQGSGLDPVQFDKVTDAAFADDGTLFVADGDLDGLNNRVLQLTAEGVVQQDWSAPNNQPGSGEKEFHLPHDIEIDRCQRVWVADALNHRIQVIQSDGTYLGELKCFGSDGVYGLSIMPQAMHTSRLFVTTSPTESPKHGTAYAFDIVVDCDSPAALPTCDPVAEWAVSLGADSMLHAVTSDPATGAIYISELGHDVPPSKWVPSSSSK